MSVWEHSRFKIFNTSQHPFIHTVEDIGYNNPRLPGVSLLGDALNYIIAVLYPNYIGTFANKAALPGSSSQNDYAIVQDDGDGKSAGYVYCTLDGVTGWVKRYDVDWSLESVLAEAVNRTQPMYVSRDGFNQKDASGNVITGLYAGQRIHGGTSSGSSLTLKANSVDSTGFVQTDSTLRPTATGLDLGTVLLPWNGIFGTSLKLGTLSISAGSISDSSGSISLGSSNLTSVGSIGASSISASGNSQIAGFSLTSSTHSITHSSGSIAFGNNNLSTTGSLTVNGNGAIAGLQIQSGSYDFNCFAENQGFPAQSGVLISPPSGQGVYLGGSTVKTDGALIAEIIDAGTIRSEYEILGYDRLISSPGGDSGVSWLNGKTWFIQDSTAEILTSGGTLTITNGLIVGGTSQFNQNVTINSAKTLSVGSMSLSGSTLTANSGLTIATSGNGVQTDGSIVSTVSGKNLGSSSNPWTGLYLSGSLFSDSSTSIATATITSFRDSLKRNVAGTQSVQDGDTLVWSATNSRWLASPQASTISHSTLSNLTSGDAGHTQFVMLAGRSGGQAVQGGTAASENLTLESTSHVTKGSILTKDTIKPNSDASYSSSWSGVDLGDSTHNFRDVYTKGQMKGLRLESYTSSSLPAASAASPGRLVFATDTKKVMLDLGGSWAAATVGKFLADIVFDGTQTTQTIALSTDSSNTISDARRAIWQVKQNSNGGGGFEVIYPTIEAISATQVKITSVPALPAGAYRLTGIE